MYGLMQDRLVPANVRHYRIAIEPRHVQLVETSAPKPKLRQTLSVDLGELRAPLLAACEVADVRPGEAIRSLVSSGLRGELPTLFVREPAVEYGRRGKPKSDPAGVESIRSKDGVRETKLEKVTVRLGVTEREVVAELAERERFTVSRWIAALVRARLLKGAQFSREELQALADSTGQLGAIGRNLNQVARALNSQDHHGTAYDRALIDELRAEIRSHQAVVSKLILSNLSRWQVAKR